METIADALAVRVKAYNKYGHNSHQLELTTRSPWFDSERVIIRVYSDYVSITKPTIDYRGKSSKVQFKTTDIKNITLSDELPLGYLFFDEEDSTEDELIIYFED